MKIAVHTLVKNEENYLWYAVKSIVDYVDEVLIWDTGSTDNTPKIAELLRKEYPNKIIFKERKQVTAEDFTSVRQEMLDETKSDWFLVLDGDEIWFEDSIKKVVETIHNKGNSIESVVVPTINLVGDIFHYQEEKAGLYKLAGRVGHLALRAINRKIPGLHSLGRHGVWGWVDGEDKMIQERDQNKMAFVNVPYLHTTYLVRSGGGKDAEVIKRKMKRKYEIGNPFPKDFFYPEVFFMPRPDIVKSPWEVMDSSFATISFFETPLRKIKRKIWRSRVGY